MSYSSYGNERLPFPFQDDLGSEVLAPDNQNVPSNAGTNTDPCLPRQSSSASSRSALESNVEQHTQPNVDVENFPAQSSSSTSSSSVKKFAEIVAIQESCMRALIDPDQELALRLWNQSLEDMKNHYAPDIEKALSGEHQPTTNAPGNGGISVVDSLLEQIKHPMDPHMRLIYIKGHIPAISVDPIGSRFILKKLDTATTGEIIMLYNEIMPHIHTLIINVFANSVIHKLLDYGPAVYTRKLVGNLLGHVLNLSLQLYGCRVIQKAFEVADTDQKIEMAKELGSNLLKCACDQHANHAIQKCIEFVPPHHIQFVYRSLCGKVKMLSSHTFGYHVIQKALEFCKDPQMKHAIVTEILESVNELSVDPYGNFVVQYIVEHGEPHERQIIVLKFDGRVMEMSHQKHSCMVIEKCLIHGSYMDRKRIIVEILCAAGGTTADHLLGMMVHEYANFVIQRMLEVALEWQVDVIVKLVRRHEAMLAKYPHGRDVIAQVDKVVNARAGLPGSAAPAPPQSP
ncbi:pumilio homolog 1-like [Lolium rigidum]|uniref:pumilio homolog 1-like n=1 Tax=Lolium rigidum TaxID=89674 RepID=UPI001F5C5AE2|nr:pumilio homolog 1-like [Lolium rigidum]